VSNCQLIIFLVAMVVKELKCKNERRYNLEGSHDHPVELSRCAESCCNAKLLCKQQFALAASNDQINIHLERLLMHKLKVSNKNKKNLFFVSQANCQYILFLSTTLVSNLHKTERESFSRCILIKRVFACAPKY
jgi:hypothetical protein